MQLAARKLNLVLVGRDRQELDSTARFIRSQGMQADVVVADFEQPQAIEAVIDATASKVVGLFVPAAGFGDSGEFVNSDLEIQKSMIQVNMTSVMVLSHYFANRMVDQGRGGIILVASMLGFHGAPFSANYAATKAYILSLGEAMAVELKASGVDVLVSSPGPTETGFSQRAGMAMGKTMTAQDVARDTINALGQSATVLPGFLTKFLRTSLALLPRALQVRIIGNIMKGFSQKPDADRNNNTA
jgi:short-subunit dehydrogenase